MAQGKMKVKNANIQKKAKHSKKVLGPKKGGKRKIAPKKTVKVKEQKLKLHLQKSINHTIEIELAQKAGGNFSVLKVPKQASEKKTKEKTKK